jgi:hypothetical protein
MLPMAQADAALKPQSSTQRQPEHLAAHCTLRLLRLLWLLQLLHLCHVALCTGCSCAPGSLTVT